jgi:hypothetical protein
MLGWRDVVPCFRSCLVGRVLARPSLIACRRDSGQAAQGQCVPPGRGDGASARPGRGRRAWPRGRYWRLRASQPGGAIPRSAQPESLPPGLQHRPVPSSGSVLLAPPSGPTTDAGLDIRSIWRMLPWSQRRWRCATSSEQSSSSGFPRWSIALTGCSGRPGPPRSAQPTPSAPRLVSCSVGSRRRRWWSSMRTGKRPVLSRSALAASPPPPAARRCRDRQGPGHERRSVGPRRGSAHLARVVMLCCRQPEKLPHNPRATMGRDAMRGTVSLRPSCLLSCADARDASSDGGEWLGHHGCRRSGVSLG